VVHRCSNMTNRSCVLHYQFVGKVFVNLFQVQITCVLPSLPSKILEHLMICKIQCVRHHTNQWATSTPCSIKSSKYNRQVRHPRHAGTFCKALSPEDFTTPDMNPTLTSPFTETNINVMGFSTIVISSFTDDTGHNSWSESGSALITCKLSCKTGFIFVTSCCEMYQVFYFVQGLARKCQFGSGSMRVLKGIFIYDCYLQIFESEIHVSFDIQVTSLKHHQVLNLETSVCKLPLLKLINLPKK